MSSVRGIEQQIARRVLARRQYRSWVSQRSLPDRLITGVAALVGSGLLFLHLQEAFWALFLVALVYSFGDRPGRG